MAQKPQGRNQQDRPPLEGSISAAATYKLGDAIEVTFSIRNSGTTAYQVLIWETPLEDEVTDFLTVERDGRILHDMMDGTRSVATDRTGLRGPCSERDENTYRRHFTFIPDQ
jgi:hypothetical protein